MGVLSLCCPGLGSLAGQRLPSRRPGRCSLQTGFGLSVFFFLDQSYFFHMQCLGCHALDDRPCGRSCRKWVLVSLRQAAECYSVGGETGKGPEMVLMEKVAGRALQTFPACASLPHTYMCTSPRPFQPSFPSCHLLTKEQALQRDLCPCLGLTSSRSHAGVGSSPPHCCQPQGREPLVQFPECSLPFLGGHHSLVMFSLMSYTLISHGPSPPLQMCLWGDICSHPLAGKDQIIPRKHTAPVPTWQAASISPPHQWDIPTVGPTWSDYTIPAVIPSLGNCPLLQSSSRRVQ